MRWTLCLLPPVAALVLLEMPYPIGLDDSISRAGLIALSPFLLLFDFAVTAAIIGLAHCLSGRSQLSSRAGFTLLTLVLVGLLNPIIYPAYLDRNWLLVGAIELGSLPAALFLAPKPTYPDSD